MPRARRIRISRFFAAVRTDFILLGFDVVRDALDELSVAMLKRIGGSAETTDACSILLPPEIPLLTDVDNTKSL